jgi:hypothetical protein
MLQVRSKIWIFAEKKLSLKRCFLHPLLLQLIMHAELHNPARLEIFDHGASTSCYERICVKVNQRDGIIIYYGSGGYSRKLQVTGLILEVRQEK